MTTDKAELFDMIMLNIPDNMHFCMGGQDVCTTDAQGVSRRGGVPHLDALTAVAFAVLKAREMCIAK